MAKRLPRNTSDNRKRNANYPNSGTHRYTRRNKAAILRRKRRNRAIVVTSILVALLVLAFLAVFFFLPVYSSIQREAGSQITLRDFLRFPDENASFAEDSEEFDPSVPGVYKIRVKSRLGEHSCTLTIEDTTLPELTLQDVTIGKDETCEAADFIASCEDATETKARFVKDPDLSLVGQDQAVTIDVVDLGGNRVEKTAVLTILPVRFSLSLEAGSAPPDISAFTGETEFAGDENTSLDNYFITDVSSIDYNTVGENDIELMYHGTIYPGKICIVDTQPPQFISADDFTVFYDDPIRYKEHVSIQENTGEYDLEVDTSQVDTSTPGTYPVTYTATDKSGNSSSVTVQMSIIEKTADEEALFARVDEILAGLLTDDMSKTEKAWAIYGWIRTYVGWMNESPKDDYISAATRALDWGGGDCYAYFSLAKVMLTRAGIKNMDIERIPEGDEMHYWNLVDVDDGHGWYHFDATPFEPLYTSCLCTDAEMMELNSYGQYNYDRSLYPEIP